MQCKLCQIIIYNIWDSQMLEVEDCLLSKSIYEKNLMINLLLWLGIKKLEKSTVAQLFESLWDVF